MDAKVVRHDDAHQCHDNDGNKGTWHFLADEWGASDDDHRQDAYDGSGEVNSAEVLDITYPFLDEVCWYSTFDMES